VIKADDETPSNSRHLNAFLETPDLVTELVSFCWRSKQTKLSTEE
jgi:hypothetical protein